MCAAANRRPGCHPIACACLVAWALTCAAPAADPSPRPAAAHAAVGPADLAGLPRLGRLRTRRSEEIGGSAWGVSCHWLADEHPLSVVQRLDQLSATGAKWALLVPDWDRIEQQPGTYDWNTAAHRFDDVIAGLTRRKILPIVQVYGGNRLYMPAAPDPNKRPLADARMLLADPQVRPAWHRFLEALVQRYKARVRHWEIWNEPNYPGFWLRPTSIDEYGQLVKAAAAVIKGVQPTAVILAGSTANVPLNYLQGVLASPGADSFDHWSVHPYGELPEAADRSIQAAGELLRARGRSTVLWQSECGFPSSPDTGGWGFGGPWDGTKHAKWVLRRLLSDAALQMRVSIYFVLHDYPALLEAGPHRGQMGINRKGLYAHGSWQPKPAARAFANLSTLLDDRMEPMAGPPPRIAITGQGAAPAVTPELIRTYRLKHRPSGQPAVVYWLAVPMQTQFPPLRATLSWPQSPIARPVLVDLLTGVVYALPQGERTAQVTFERLPLTDSPLVLCSRDAVELAADGGRP